MWKLVILLRRLEPGRIMKSVRQSNKGAKFVLAAVTLLSLMGYVFIEYNFNSGYHYRFLGNLSTELITEDFNTSVGPQSVTILIWTMWFGSVVAEDTLIDGSSGLQCHVTSNRSQINDSQAVVFHIRDLNWADFPTQRQLDQYYVFLLWESPYHTFNDGLRSVRHQWAFNLSMSYRRDSDVYVPYGHISKRRSPVGQDLNQLIKHKEKLIMWMVSNCQTPSRREVLVQKLQQYIKVDIYGHCGISTCGKHANVSRSPSQCEKLFEQTYKFYLAFENSLCIDYVTEKLFQHLQLFMVPIVLERKNYAHFSPGYTKPWFIAVDDFETVEDLAKYLLYLDSNHTAYYEYLSWHEHFESFVDVQSDTGLLSNDHWRQLCTAVVKMDGKLSVQNVPAWWYNSSCHSASWK